MPASAPLSAMPVTVTALPLPAFLSANLAAEEVTVNTSPALRLSLRVALAVGVPS